GTGTVDGRGAGRHDHVHASANGRDPSRLDEDNAVGDDGGIGCGLHAPADERGDTRWRGTSPLATSSTSHGKQCGDPPDDYAWRHGSTFLRIAFVSRQTEPLLGDFLPTPVGAIRMIRRQSCAWLQWIL